jgi:hypothetical protein
VVGLEADHLPPSRAKVKNEWSMSSTSLCASMVCTGTGTVVCGLIGFLCTLLCMLFQM